MTEWREDLKVSFIVYYRHLCPVTLIYYMYLLSIVIIVAILSFQYNIDAVEKCRGEGSEDGVPAN